MEMFLTDAATGPVNVMIDLETWGTAPGCAIRSIGAVMFDPYDTVPGEEFYVNIIDETCLSAGLVKDASTVAWWAKPDNAKAAEVFAKDPKSLGEGLTTFVAWCRRQRAIFPWSQGANFDQPIIEAAMRLVGVTPPWKFWDSRCTRTAYDMGGINVFKIVRQGIAHNALDDAKHQARCVQAAYRNVQLKVRHGGETRR